MSRVNKMISKVQDLINPDNEEFDEEYLDRLGVSDDEINQNTNDFFEDDEGVINVFPPNRVFENDGTINPNSMRDLHRDYNRIRDYSSIIGDNNDYSNNSIDQQRQIRWVNGDCDVRQVRQRPQQQYYDRAIREQTSDFVHEKIYRTKMLMMDFILNEIQDMVNEFIQTINTSHQGIEKVIETIVGHYLEDIGDDLISRGRCRCERSPSTLGTALYIEFELPNCGIRKCTIDLDILRR